MRSKYLTGRIRFFVLHRNIYFDTIVLHLIGTRLSSEHYFEKFNRLECKIKFIHELLATNEVLRRQLRNTILWYADFSRKLVFKSKIILTLEFLPSKIGNLFDNVFLLTLYCNFTAFEHNFRTWCRYVWKKCSFIEKKDISNHYIVLSSLRKPLMTTG